MYHRRKVTYIKVFNNECQLLQKIVFANLVSSGVFQSSVASKSVSDISKMRHNTHKLTQHALRHTRHAEVDRSDTQSMRSSRRGHLKPMLQLQNTFRTEPPDDERVHVSDMQQVCQQVLDELLRDVTYNERMASNLTRTLSNSVKERVKSLHLPRYKFVVTSLIGEKAGQGLKSSSRCLWNERTDSYTSVHYENTSLFAVVNVHAVYLD